MPAGSAAPIVLRRSRATVDLDALAANYQTILQQLAGVPAAAVVKANGYGLGVVEVATTLWGQGCRQFFVARVDEGMQLRAALPTAEINVFDGYVPSSSDDLLSHDLVPILNSMDQLRAWGVLAGETNRVLPAGIHIDTGMRRLGFPPEEYEQLCREPDLLNGVEVRHILSHLASADVSSSEQSADQLELFTAIRERLPMGAASLANSAGIFLGSAYHFDLARPGIALYGGSPFPDSGLANPMRSVVTLEAPIIQVQSAATGASVGYGATHRLTSDSRIATIPVGYADGFLRSISNTGMAAIQGQPTPIVGRVSMDLITLDVSSIDERFVYPGAPVELVGEHCPIDEVAELAGSIPHEFLTNLSRRFELRYIGGPE
ncbi:MAG: alanine racemase [Acidimicrobiales bacterium]